MDDKELLKFAAKAAGYPIHSDAKWVGAGGGTASLYMGERGPKWNPLTDDGDALRLMVKLQLELTVFRDHVTAFHATSWCDEIHDGDPEAATRRAIVRAAAEVGGSTQ